MGPILAQTAGFSPQTGPVPEIEMGSQTAQRPRSEGLDPLGVVAAGSKLADQHAKGTPVGS
jgi:hypothetical protein